MTIPVLICPIVNGEDLLRRMLASVDEPVGQLVIVDMTPGQRVDIPGARYIRPLESLGLAGAINAGIMQTPGAPWWMFASHDLVFGPGDLREITELMEAGPGPCFITGDRADERLLRNAYGAVNLAAIEAVGLLDEHTFFPLYFDDDDWQWRCQLGGVEWVEYNGTIAHDRSSTIRHAGAAEGNARTYPENRRRYVEKWGGPPGREAFVTPWGLPGVPLSFTRPDPRGRAARRWILDDETTMLEPDDRDELR